MTRPTVSKPGEEHWKVRIVLPGALLHLASRTEPKVWTAGFPTEVREVEADWIVGTDKGDTPGFIDWSAALAVTWRRTGTEE